MFGQQVPLYLTEPDNVFLGVFFKAMSYQIISNIQAEMGNSSQVLHTVSDYSAAVVRLTFPSGLRSCCAIPSHFIPHQ